jgi:uncharacterized protein (UPF0332 family)
MTPQEAKETYIRYRLERSHESLEAAKLLASASLFPEVINRLYYAAFYAVNALLYQHSLSSKRHGGVQALFNQHFVKTGLVSESLGDLYNKLFTLRQQSDYEDLYRPNPDEVRQMIPQVEAFIEAISRLIESTKTDEATS